MVFRVSNFRRKWQERKEVLKDALCFALLCEMKVRFTIEMVKYWDSSRNGSFCWHFGCKKKKTHRRSNKSICIEQSRPHLWPGLGLALSSLKGWGNGKRAMLYGMWKWSGNFIFICKHWNQPGLCICATSWLHSFHNGGAEQLGQKTQGLRG